jgi:hypothetical protein
MVYDPMRQDKLGSSIFGGSGYWAMWEAMYCALLQRLLTDPASRERQCRNWSFSGRLGNRNSPKINKRTTLRYLGVHNHN